MPNVGTIRISILMLALLFAGCSTSKSTQSSMDYYQQARLAVSQKVETEEASEWPEAKEVGIAPGYEILLTSTTDTNLNGRYRIGFDGMLELPYDVFVETKEVTGEEELARAIANAYGQFFRGKPQITLRIVDRRFYVDVQGLVENPGQYLAKRDSTLDELISLAGGSKRGTRDAGEVARFARITRGKASRIIRLSEYYGGAEDLVPEWQGGDAVFLLSEAGSALTQQGATGGYVQVLGMVTTPGEYTYDQGRDFFHYLGRAGGPTPQADLENIEIIRTNGERLKSIRFKMSNVNKVPDIQSGDILVFHADRPSTFVPSVAAIIGAISTAVIAGVAL